MLAAERAARKPAPKHRGRDRVMEGLRLPSLGLARRGGDRLRPREPGSRNVSGPDGPGTGRHPPDHSERSARLRMYALAGLSRSRCQRVHRSRSHCGWVFPASLSQLPTESCT